MPEVQKIGEKQKEYLNKTYLLQNENYLPNMKYSIFSYQNTPFTRSNSIRIFSKYIVRLLKKVFFKHLFVKKSG